MPAGAGAGAALLPPGTRGRCPPSRRACPAAGRSGRSCASRGSLGEEKGGREQQGPTAPHPPRSPERPAGVMRRPPSPGNPAPFPTLRSWGGRGVPCVGQGGPVLPWGCLARRPASPQRARGRCQAGPRLDEHARLAGVSAMAGQEPEFPPPPRLGFDQAFRIQGLFAPSSCPLG